MKHIRQEMDDLFRDTERDIDMPAPRFDASASVQDKGNDYVASFYLPKRDLSNVKVNVKDDVLIVQASAEQTIKDKSPETTGTSGAIAGSETEMLNQYEQLVSLPGPVNAAKMQVQKNGDTLTVTLPKTGTKESNTASAK
jgi:HSP20 family molecular chaperone IbpA